MELFAGVGGFHIGLNHIESFDEKTGTAIDNGQWTFTWTNQFEPSTKSQPAYECLATRFANDVVSNEDITTVNPYDIPDANLLVGGHPCQNFSVAATLNKSTGIEGEKGVLFWNIMDIAVKKDVPFLLLENVDRMLKCPANQKGRDFGMMLRAYTDAGYDIEWRVINGADYGFTQKRRRVFVFAWQQSTNYGKAMKKEKPADIILTKGIFAKAFPVETDDVVIRDTEIDEKQYRSSDDLFNDFSFDFGNAGCLINGHAYAAKITPIMETPVPMRDILENSEDVPANCYITKEQDEKMVYFRKSKRLERTRADGTKWFYSEGAMDYPDPIDKPARTMLTSEGSINRTSHVICDPKTNKNRILTPIECERIQGFPDNWTNTGMTDKKRRFVMGNALICGVVARLEPEISKIFDNER